MVKCPKCDGPMSVLGGCSAHDNNWYCNDLKCGWQAWDKTTAQDRLLKDINYRKERDDGNE